MRRADGVLYEVAGGRAVLVDPGGRELITLNRVGTHVWDLLDGTRGRDDIVARLASDFPDVEPGRLGCDVDAFLDELRALGVVTG